MSEIERWWSAGETVAVDVGGAKRAIFVRRMGSGPTMTMLHGFPSSSHDWAKVAAAMSERYSLLLADFLGFGASEKPVEHTYSLHEQTDLIEALWAMWGISATVIVAHDYGVSVAQELLARRAEGSLGVELVAVHLLNGGLYPKLARLQPGQIALLDPELGPRIGANVTEELFVAGLKPTFAEDFDAAEDSAEIWRATSRGSGQTIGHRVIQYVNDRAEHGERWVGALESTDVPLSFVWGMLDPVSGAHIARRVRERLPGAPMLALEQVSHWPALEAPGQLACALLDA